MENEIPALIGQLLEAMTWKEILGLGIGVFALGLLLKTHQVGKAADAADRRIVSEDPYRLPNPAPPITRRWKNRP